jgi:hypothetical protein
MQASAPVSSWTSRDRPRRVIERDPKTPFFFVCVVARLLGSNGACCPCHDYLLGYTPRRCAQRPRSLAWGGLTTNRPAFANGHKGTRRWPAGDPSARRQRWHASVNAQPSQPGWAPAAIRDASAYSGRRARRHRPLPLERSRTCSRLPSTMAHGERAWRTANGHGARRTGMAHGERAIRSFRARPHATGREGWSGGWRIGLGWPPRPRL